VVVFLDHTEIPPDNNLAERTLRLAVTKRKEGGSVIEFFRQAIKAIVNLAVQSPSLIPQVST